MSEIKTDFNSIPEIYPAAAQVIVYHEGEATTYARGSAAFAQIMAALAEMSVGAHDMPAYGVSLDQETRQARTTGLWVELVFAEEQYFDGYNFESLLIAVKPADSGFNLIRKVAGKYEGRCLYLSLSGNMQVLHDTLQALV